MRKQILGLTTAALAVGSLALGLGGPAAQATAGIDGGNVSGLGPLPSAVSVVASTPGDAVVAWVRPTIGGVRIQASHATDGVWAAPVSITPGAVDAAESLHLVANGKGDVAAVWTQLVNGQQRVRAARYLGGGTWDGAVGLSAPDINDINDLAADIDDAGRVHVAIGAQNDTIFPLRMAVWEKGKSPVLSSLDTFGVDPSIDVNPAGTVLVGYFGAEGQQSVAKVRRRTPTTGWTSDRAQWAGAVTDVHVRLTDGGHGTLLFGGVQGEVMRSVAAKVTASGSVGGSSPLSDPGVTTFGRGLALSPDGTALASWGEFTGDTYVLRSALRTPTGDFGSPQLTVGTSLNQPRPIPFVTDGGARVVVSNADNQLNFRHQKSSAQLPGTYIGGDSDGAFDASSDRQGNVVAASIIGAGGSSYVQADFLDTAGPVSTVTSPVAAQTLATSFAVKWTAIDALAGTKHSDVIYSSAKWNSSTFSAPAVIGDNLAASPYAFKGGFGRTYCFEIQSVDKASNLGFRSSRKCTSVPLDDRSLKGAGWSRRSKSGHFNKTVSTTSTKGRVLTRTNVKARRLALVATKLPSAGTVRVTFNGKSLGTFSLKGKTTKKKVIPIVTFSKVRSGTVKIKVISANGRAVLIDGLVVAK